MKIVFNLLAFTLPVIPMFTQAESSHAEPKPETNIAMKTENFDQNGKVKDHYNLQEIQTVSDLGTFKIRTTDNGITFDKKHGEITTATLYNHLDTEFNFNHAYRITDDLNNTSYFRFGWVSIEGDRTIFSNVKWLNENHPVHTEEFKEVNITVVELKFIQFGKTTVCTIGDSQTWWDNAQQLRKSIDSTCDELVFIGSNTDIFGYGHEGEGGNDTNAVLRRLHRIPPADVYTLLLGTNDWTRNPEIIAKKIQKISDHLISLNPDAIILYLTPLPTTNIDRDTFNGKLSNILSTNFEGNSNIQIVDLRSKMLENKDWATAYLSSDGLHQNINGVELMGTLIAEKIKSLKINQ